MRNHKGNGLTSTHGFGPDEEPTVKDSTVSRRAADSHHGDLVSGLDKLVTALMYTLEAVKDLRREFRKSPMLPELPKRERAGNVLRALAPQMRALGDQVHPEGATRKAG